MASSRGGERAGLMCLATMLALDATSNPLGSHSFLVSMLECKSGHYSKKWGFHIISIKKQAHLPVLYLIWGVTKEHMVSCWHQPHQFQHENNSQQKPGAVWQPFEEAMKVRGLQCFP